MDTTISVHVPVRSIWLLQLYASAVYQAGMVKDSAVEDADADLPVLVASMLVDAVSQRLDRELSVGFVRTAAPLHRVRGRIDVFETVRHGLQDKGLVACRFNDLSVDTPVNRYLMGALDVAATMMRRLGEEALAQRCRRLASVFARAGVGGVGVGVVAPRGRLMPVDQKPVRLAELLLAMKVPAPGRGPVGLRRTNYSEEQLRALFEKALLGLYRHHLGPKGYTVRGGEQLRWAATGSTGLLPGMRTDITLRAPGGQRYVIDAKFTDMVTKAPWSGADQLKSGHVYQLMAYLLSQRARGDGWENATGVMMYATTSGSDFEEFEVEGHRVVFAAVDLECSALEIRKRVLRTWSNRKSTSH